MMEQQQQQVHTHSMALPTAAAEVRSVMGPLVLLLLLPLLLCAWAEHSARCNVGCCCYCCPQCCGALCPLLRWLSARACRLRGGRPSRGPGSEAVGSPGGCCRRRRAAAAGRRADCVAAAQAR